jgi:hypothetical protein
MATAVIISRRRRRQQQLSEGLSREEMAATTLQAAFRGYRVRTSSGTLREIARTNNAATIVIPVRTAARVLREGERRRTGCVRLGLYVAYLAVFAAALLTTSDRQNTYGVRSGIVQRLESIRSPDGDTFRELHTLDAIGEWIPAAALALRSEPRGGAGTDAAASAGGPGAGGRPTSETLDAARNALNVAPDGTRYLPNYGLVSLYNRPVPYLLVSMRRRQMDEDGSCSGVSRAPGVAQWVRPCWHREENTSDWIGVETGRAYVWDANTEAFTARFTLGFPPLPCVLCLTTPPALPACWCVCPEYAGARRWTEELLRWEEMLSDGFLSHRTLDITVVLVLINGNANTLCTAEISWKVQPTGLITNEMHVVAIPMTLKPRKGTLGGSVSAISRLLSVVLTVVHIAHLVNDWRTRSPLLFSATPTATNYTAGAVLTQLHGPRGQARLKKMAAVEQIGAQACIVIVLIGIVLAEALGDLSLPDINMLGAEPQETQRVLSLFVADMREKTQNIQTVNQLMALAWVLATVKLVRMLDFDPRLSLVSRTVSRAWNELAFFMLSAGLIVFGYSLSGSVIYGDEHDEFVNPPSSIGTAEQRF